MKSDFVIFCLNTQRDMHLAKNCSSRETVRSKKIELAEYHKEAVMAVQGDTVVKRFSCGSWF